MTRKSPEEEAKEAAEAKRAFLIALVLGLIVWGWVTAQDFLRAACWGSC